MYGESRLTSAPGKRLPEGQPLAVRRRVCVYGTCKGLSNAFYGGKRAK